MRFAVLALLAALALRCAAAQTSTAARTAAAHAEARSGAAAVVTGESRSGRSGLTYVWLRPAVDGVEVADDPALVVLDDAGAVVHTRGEIAGGAVESATDALGPDAAVERAAAATGTAARGASGAEPSARRVFVRTATGALRLAYAVALYPADASRWSVVQIDAATGAVLSERRLAIFEHADGAVPALPDARPEAPLIPFIETLPSVLLPDGASYRVVAPPGRSPLDGGRALVLDPADALASPFGWHDTDARPGPEFTTTRGNNAIAYPDRDFNGQPDAAGVPDGGAALAFDFALDEAAGPEASREAGVTNAFFWVNHAHDVFYHYGFDEAGGNFQANAYGRGGGNPSADPVQVLVQNGSAINNSFIAVPADGISPTMYLLESTRTAPRRDYALDAEVVVHEITHGLTARLTGGPRTNECLSTGGEDMAEGWSDWYALMLTMRPGETRADARPFGTYTGGPDVRIAPYATDFATNDLTYGSTVGMTARHAVGTVWATVLWELTWDLIDAHGFSPTLTDARGAAGNLVALSLVTEALRLQPCRPGFVDARNAILLADALLYQGVHRDLLQTAFARRGLGQGAAQGLSSTTEDNVASFAVGPVDFDAPAAASNLVATADVPTTIRLTFTAPGDDGAVGRAARYEVRYSMTPISPGSFEQARLVLDVSSPQPAGTTETVTIRDRAPNTLYYLAVRAFDDVGNASPLALASVQTPYVTPPPGPPPTDVVFPDSVVVSVEAGHIGRVVVPVQYNGTAATAITTGLVGDFGFAFDYLSLGSTPDPSAFYPHLARSGVAPLVLEPASPDHDREDAGYADVALPFTFPFGSLSASQMRISTDGYVALVYGAPSAVVPDRLGAAALPNAVIAPYWADLRIAPGGGIYADTLADGRFAVEFDQMVVVGRPADAPFSFAVTLGASGEISLVYGHMPAGVGQALRGIEAASGPFSLSIAGPPEVDTVELFVPTRVVLSIETSGVVVTPGATALFEVVADARTLRPGRYRTGFYATATGYYSFMDIVPLLVDVAERTTTTPPPVEPPTVSAVELRAARPNPTRGRTAVSFALPAALPVRLVVVDARGREVAVLAEGTFEAGPHEAAWDAAGAAPGLYAVRLVAGREARTATVVVVR